MHQVTSYSMHKIMIFITPRVRKLHHLFEKITKKDRELHCIETIERMHNLKEAACKRGHEVMVQRLQKIEILSCKALYHSACLSSYVSKENLRYVIDKDELEDNLHLSTHDIAFTNLIQQIGDDLIHNKKGFFLSDLLSTYKSFLPVDLASSYTCAKLQQKLQNYYREAICVQTQHGQENPPLS